MPTRPVYLLIYGAQTGRRSHVGLWSPYHNGNGRGTVIHVVGAPMVGFFLEFKRCYDPETTSRKVQLVALGAVDAQLVHDADDGPLRIDTTPMSELEALAATVKPPGVSRNLLAPSRNCQDWLTEYVRRLVEVGYLEEAAIAILESKQEGPEAGIRLRPVADRLQGVQQQQDSQQRQQKDEQEATAE